MALRYIQPQGALQIDWGNPITRGLLRYVDPYSGSLVSISGPRVQFTTRGGRAVTSVGRVISTDGVSTTYATSNGAVFNGLSAVSCFHLTRVNALPIPSFGDVIRKDGEFTPLQIDRSTGYGFAAIWTGGTIRLNQPAFVVPIGVFLQHFAVYDGSAFRFGWGGSTPRSNTVSGTGTVDSASGTPLVIGSTGTGGEWQNCDVAFCAWWGRGLSPSEVASLSANPWQIFTAGKYVLKASAGGGATANGVTVAALASFIAGTASGERNATVNGVLVNATASILTGAASGGASATASGALVSATATIIVGTATGVINASAAGQIMAVTASFLAGAASGNIVPAGRANGKIHISISISI